MRAHTAPTGAVPKLCLDILNQPHTLIAGATGSGKSVLINSLIYTALFDSPNKTQLILIDPKRVELIDYKPLPHTMAYGSEPREIAKILKQAVALMDRRYADMQKRHIKHYDGSDIYIIVDEFADLMTTQKRETLPTLCRIAQLGRAAGIHLILATQRPTRDIINGQIKVNIDSRVALRCPTKQDSRNIINTGGAELLPRYGSGYYLTPDTMTPVLVNIPMTDPAEISNIISYWTRKARRW
ncbi:MAG: DNA translocase FtsK, partial [Ruminococcus sp.]|nr:DNA translocase FtsK [Ruminococcus sp.]MBQ4238630.1 DNA translocase FtsK [Ruminococcus sp.]